MTRRPTGAGGRGFRRAAAVLGVAATALVSCASPDPTAGSGGSSGPDTAVAPRTPLGPVDAVRTVVLGDETTSPDPAWPEFLADSLADEGIPMAVRTVAEAGAGFSGSPAFADSVAGSAEGSTQLIVLFDGRIGTDDGENLAEAERNVFVAVERTSPDARLVVVGPLPETNATSHARDALRTEALDAGATFVDPVVENWPEGASQEELAGLLRPHMAELVGALAESGANR